MPTRNSRVQVLVEKYTSSLGLPFQKLLPESFLADAVDEEKIRELVIILGGKCIAILLEKLSECYEAQARALEQTKGWWRKRTGKNGSRKRTILTMGNVEVTLNLPYVVERLPKPRKKKKPPLQGFCPFLRWLGLEKRVTPLVWSKIAEYGTMSHHD